MGLFSWLAKRRVEKAIGTLKQYAGKDRAELAREGGWNMLAGADFNWLTSQWQNANSIWKRFSEKDMEIAYAAASTIHACIRIKCITARQAWFEVGSYSAKGWKSIENHPFYRLMRRPNGGQDTAGFIWEFVAHAETTGWSYVWKLRDRGGNVIAIQPLPKSWVRKHHNDRTGVFEHYAIKSSLTGGEIHIRPEDMFVMKYPNPADPTGAAGPLGAALRDLQVDDARADLLIEMLSNLHFPGAIFKSEHGWTPDDKEEARAVLRDVIGPGKRANPLFVNGTKSEVELPKPPPDMDWPGTAMQAETRICAAFGVPPIMVHFRAGLENGTYSNYEQARRSFYQDTMRSLWDMMASAFERGLLIDEGEDDLEMRANYDDIPEMQEDEDRRHERIRNDFHGGLMMWNKAIEAVGGEPLPGKMGEIYLWPMAVQPIEISNEPGGSALEEEEIEEDDELDEEHLDDDGVTVEDEEEADDEEEAAGGKSIIVVGS